MASDMFYGAPPQLFDNARQLREAMTPAEQHLWEALRMNRFEEFRFKPQHPINHFVADFYCHAARLVIELDGSVHDSIDQQEYDDNRTYKLEEFGIRVIRFKNHEVFNSLEQVLAEIATYLPDKAPHTNSF